MRNSAIRLLDWFGNEKGNATLVVLIGLLFATFVISAIIIKNVGQSTKLDSQAQAATSSTKPNIVVIMTDDQSDTPHILDKMPLTTSLIAAQGATFNKNYDTTSLCCPSRSTFLTGMYAHNHHVWSNNSPDGGYAIFNQYDKNQNLPIWLKNAGYTTTLIGKYLNGYGPKSTVIPAGWSEWYGLDDGGAEGKYYSYYINQNGVVKFYGTGDANYNTTVLTNKAVSFINKHAADSAPYFMYIAYIAPHGDPDASNSAVPATQDLHTFDNEPLPNPPNFNEADVSDKNSYIAALPLFTSTDINDITTNYRNRLGALQSVDRGVQSVYNTLQSTGKLNNTIIIFTSDNGFEQGEHRIKKAKGYPYEESLRVPLLVKGPNVPVEVINNKMTANIDLAPTIVSLANATAGVAMDGSSLVPLWQNPTGTPWRTKLLIEGPSQMYFTLRRDNSQYTHVYTGETEYYGDLTVDPWELNASKTLVQSEEDALNVLKTCAGATCVSGGL